MGRIIFAALLFVHGFIHLIGFYSEWKLGPSPPMSGKTLFTLDSSAAHISGIIWLFTALTFTASGAMYILRNDSFWIPALGAIIISQLLIVFYWHDAKFGTIANVIILIVIIFYIARSNFNNRIDQEVSTMFDAVGKGSPHSQASRASLPPIVQRWLDATKVTEKVPSKIRLTQTGTMRSKPSAGWMNFSAVQYYTVDPPAFIWNSKINAGSMVTIAGRDKFGNGKGNMLIKPFYIYTLANATGEEIDQGTMLRFMGELIWFPEAAVMDYFHWEEVDSTSAALSMTYNGVRARGTFTFNENGLVKSFSAQRFGDFDGEFRKETWEVQVTEHKVINGHLIGSKCDVIWKLKEGDFTWLTLEVKDITYEYN
jgi:hypothetical protein